MPEIIVPRLPYDPPLPGAVMDPSHPLARGLVGWWPLNGDCVDYSGKGNHGTPTNFNWDTTDGWRPGHHSQKRGLLFDGTDDNVVCVTTKAIKLTGPMSMSGWFNGNGPSGSTTGIGRLGSSGNRGYMLGTEQGNVAAYVAPTSVTLFTTSTSGHVETIWMHYTMVFAPSVGLYLYRDGLWISSNEISPPSSQYDSSQPMKIGARSNQANYFTGSIQDVRIYNRVLNAAEVAMLYRTPYAMMRPTIHRFYSIPASVGAVGGIFESSIFGGVLVR